MQRNSVGLSLVFMAIEATLVLRLLDLTQHVGRPTRTFERKRSRTYLRLLSLCLWPQWVSEPTRAIFSTCAMNFGSFASPGLFPERASNRR